jgi:ABC-2 type transport system ATP-binding protein
MVTAAAQKVWKSLGGRIVLRGAELVVAQGERVALVGENGSGKSTLLQVLCGVLEADRGRVEVNGAVGYAPEKPEIPLHLLVREWLDVVASLKGVRVAPPEDFGVRPLLGKVVSTLSLGQRQRVSLAAAFLGSPALLVLDEPTNGLDAATHDELVRRLRGATALVATHDRAFAAAIDARVLSVRTGVIV